jgi:hypothetical protein
MTQATELRELASLIHVDGSNARVGIGSTAFTPSYELHISGTGSKRLKVEKTDSGGDVDLQLSSPNDSTQWILFHDRNSGNNSGVIKYVHSTNKMHFRTNDVNDRLVIADDGNIGIGTDDPNGNGNKRTLHMHSAASGAAIRLSQSDNALIRYDDTAGLQIGTLGAKDFILETDDVTAMSISGDAQNVNFTHIPSTDEVRHDIVPTLSLDFANSKQLDSRITFYRDSVATYYSKEGKLMYATNNEPRFDHDPVTGESKGLMIEGTVTNSIVNSNPMRWTGNNAVYVVDNAAKAPDGTYSAVKIQDIASTNSIFHGTYQHVSVTNGVAYTISGYFKAGTEDVVGFRMYDGSSMVMRGQFNLNSGTPSLINGTSIDMQDVGDGWYRCSMVGTATNTTTTADVYIFTTSVYTHTSTGDNSIYAWGIQHEASPILSSYMPTDTKFSNRSTTASYYDKDGIVRYAPRDTPRYGYKYDGRKWVETGLITENAATNTVSYSHFQEGWSIPNVRHGYGEEITAPDGTTIRSVTANSTYNLIRQSNVFDNTTAGTATLSFWAKAISTTGNESITFDFGDMAGSGFNTASGLTSEWKRFTYTQSWTANQTIHNFLDFSLGNNTEMGIWGIQVETGSEATSYIPTYDTDAIRVADTVLSQNKSRTSDSAYIDGKHFEDFYNPDEGTMYIDYQLGAKLAQFRILALTKHNTNTDFIEFIGGWGSAGATTGGTYMFGPNSTGSSVNTSGSTITNVAYERRKFAGRISHNDFYAVTQNSTAIAQAGDTDAGVAVFERLNFGDYNHTDSQKMFGHIRKVVYYPEALTNAELIALTENN